MNEFETRSLSRNPLEQVLSGEGRAEWPPELFREGQRAPEAELQGLSNRLQDLRVLVRWLPMAMTSISGTLGVAPTVEASRDAAGVVRFAGFLVESTEGPGYRVDPQGRLVIDTAQAAKVEIAVAGATLRVAADKESISWSLLRPELQAPIDEWIGIAQDEWAKQAIIDTVAIPGPLGPLHAAALLHRFSGRRGSMTDVETILREGMLTASRVETWASTLTESEYARTLACYRTEVSLLIGSLDAVLHDADLGGEDRLMLLTSSSRSRALLESITALLERAGYSSDDSYRSIAKDLSTVDALGDDAIALVRGAAPLRDPLLIRAAAYDPTAWWVRLAFPELADLDVA